MVLILNGRVEPHGKLGLSRFENAHFDLKSGSGGHVHESIKGKQIDFAAH